MKRRKSILFIMGVSGCGKSTIGSLLSKHLSRPFFDGDDFHPRENVKKMSAGVPLTDEDRVEWLERLNTLAIKNKTNGAIIGCSALKESYRYLLEKDIEQHTAWIFLHGNFQEIWQRMQRREDHFMPVALLESQFNTLEPPQDALWVSIDQSPDKMVNQILKELDL